MAEIIVYSAKLCGDCQRLKAFMDEHGIAYENRDIHENETYKKDLEEKTGKLGVPYLIIDGEWKIGYEKGVGFSEAWAKEIFNISD